jgi:hypothetical protein
MRFIKIVLLCIAIAACKQPRQTNANQSQPINESQSATSIPPGETLNLQQYLEEPLQVFSIANNGSTTITAKHGLRLEVKKEDFESDDGATVKGTVELTVKELVTPQQMIASDCPTVSDGRLLETAGSYFIGASGNGSKLRLKQGKKIRIEFPKRGDNMELFYGQRMADGSMNWLPLQKKLAGAAVPEKKSENKIGKAEVIKIEAPASPGMQSGNAADGAAGTGRFLTPEAWLKAYEDTIVERRRAIVRKNFKQMTQEQLRKLMGAPFKIAKKDLAWLKLDTTRLGRGKLNYYRFKDFDLRITSPPLADSVQYVRDSLRLLAKEFSRDGFSLNYTPAENLETAIDTVKPVKAIQNGKLVTVPGRVKVTISYYEPVELDQLGWINCDRFYNYPEGVVPEYTIDINGTVPSEIGVYIICKNINGVMSNKILTDGQSKNIIRQQLPLNTEVEFLVYSKIDKQFLQSKFIARITKDMIIPVDLKPVPDGQVKKVFLN